MRTGQGAAKTSCEQQRIQLWSSHVHLGGALAKLSINVVFGVAETTGFLEQVCPTRKHLILRRNAALVMMKRSMMVVLQIPARD